MSRQTAAAGLALVAAAIAACNAVAPSPSAPPSSVPPSQAAAGAPLLGDWSPTPLTLDGDQVTSLTFLCTNAGDAAMQAAMKDVEPAVVDARGGGFVSMVLSDDHAAYDCRAKIEEDGLTFTIIDSPARLDPGAVRLRAEADVAVVAEAVAMDEPGERMMVTGRVGNEAAGVRIRLPDGTELSATTDHGWFAAWWPGSALAAAVDAVDGSGSVLASARVPDDAVEGRVGPASWWVDPAGGAVEAASLTVPALVREVACASGHPPNDRLLEPEVFSSADAVLVTFWVRLRPGPQDCVGNPPFATTLELPEPLGDRRLLDGSVVPPRDAATAPTR